MSSDTDNASANANIITKSEFARANGWSKSYISKLSGEGRLVLTEEGKVLAAESLARITATTGAPERASPPAVAPQQRLDRDRQAFYDAENSRLDLEERVGKLLNAVDALAIAADVGTSLRARLEGWPARLAPQLAALGGNEQRIKALLSDHVQQALADISHRFSRLAELGAAPPEPGA